MKRLLALFFIVSFLCFGADTPDNKNTDKSTQMNKEIEMLKNQVIELSSQVMKSNNKIDELKGELEGIKKKDGENLGLIYNIDQIYTNSMKYYDKTVEDTKDIYRKSVNDIQRIMGILGTLISGILIIIAAIIGIYKKRAEKTLNKEKEDLKKLKEDTIEKIEELEIEYKENIMELNEKIKDVEFNSKIGIALNKNTPKEKIEELKKIEKKIEKLSIKNKKLLYFQLAYNNSNIEEGKRYYTKAIELDSNNSSAYHNRGLLKKDSDKEGAINDFTKVIELDPNNLKAYFIRGLLKAESDKEGAMNDFTKAIKLDPNNSSAYHNRGLLKVESDKEGAMNDFTKAIKLDPNNSSASVAIGLLKIDLDEESAMNGECL